MAAAVANTQPMETDAPERRLPVTLLSGFLGVGKTTLLKRILQNPPVITAETGKGTEERQMRVAVVVNDMGAVNIDAKDIKSHRLVQEKAQMVELQNGCICCTLRGDLLKTVKELSEETRDVPEGPEGAKEPAYDYLVIESTGIAEPLPVAQTFVMDVNGGGHEHEHEAMACPLPPKQPVDEKMETEKAEGEDANGEEQEFEPLSKVARLDTLVTVVDVFNVLDILSGIETLADRQRLLGDDADMACVKPTEVENGAPIEGGEGEGEEDEDEKPPSINQLLLDQIEFANVILLNKVDLLHPDCEQTRHKKLLQVHGLMKRLNPEAKVVVPGYDFDFDLASGEQAKDIPGKINFSKFADFDVAQVVNTGMFDMEAAQQSAGWIRELEKDIEAGGAGMGHTPETEEYGISSFVWRSKASDPRPFHPERLAEILTGFGDLAAQEKMVLENGVESQTLFAGVVRSKGQLWLPYAHSFPISISTAGRLLELNPNFDSPYVAAIPEEEWSEAEKEAKDEAIALGRWDVANGFGDRGSELVCIGMELTAERKKQISDALNMALLNDEEMKAGVEAFKNLKDGEDHPWKAYTDPFFDGEGAAQLWDLPDLGVELEYEEGNEEGEGNEEAK